MKFTDSAVSKILEIMKRKRLDPKKVFFALRTMDNGEVGIGFSRERDGTSQKFGELTVSVGRGISMPNLLVDFCEIDGRKGIIFLEENKNDT